MQLQQFSFELAFLILNKQLSSTKFKKKNIIYLINSSNNKDSYI